MEALKMADCNPSHTGQEQVLAFIRVGSLSPRVLIDLVLGHRKEQHPYGQWFQSIVASGTTATTWQQVKGVPWTVSSFEHNCDCAKCIIFMHVTVREYTYFTFLQYVLGDGTQALHCLQQSQRSM